MTKQAKALSALKQAYNLLEDKMVVGSGTLDHIKEAIKDVLWACEKDA